MEQSGKGRYYTITKEHLEDLKDDLLN